MPVSNLFYCIHFLPPPKVHCGKTEEPTPVPTPQPTRCNCGDQKWIFDEDADKCVRTCDYESYRDACRPGGDTPFGCKGWSNRHRCCFKNNVANDGKRCPEGAVVDKCNAPTPAPTPGSMHPSNSMQPSLKTSYRPTASGQPPASGQPSEMPSTSMHPSNLMQPSLKPSHRPTVYLAQ